MNGAITSLENLDERHLHCLAWSELMGLRIREIDNLRSAPTVAIRHRHRSDHYVSGRLAQPGLERQSYKLKVVGSNPTVTILFLIVNVAGWRSGNSSGP